MDENNSSATSETDTVEMKSSTAEEDGSSKPEFAVPFGLPSTKEPAKKQPQNVESQKIDYTEPSWSSLPAAGDNFYLECIKSGSQLEDFDLKKSFYSVGRYYTCDLVLEHPSLSRFHAVLQYSNGEIDANYPKGFYLLDLNSTHGTLLNKKKVESKTYIYLKIGSCIKFGGSTRLFILHGPELANADDLNFNLTHEQMKKIREKQNKLALKLRIQKEVEQEALNQEKGEKEEFDWGMGKDFENEKDGGDSSKPKTGDAALLTNASFNTGESTTDDSYYASDPRKALTIFFEREGEDLVYESEELGYSRFKCRIRLPIDNDLGEPMYAEVASFEGRKKECQAQCALEACRILDSIGILRHSSSEYKRKRMEKDYQSNDYYDSDDDTYLDRTGDIEKKRLKRINKYGTESSSEKAGSKVHTFESLKQDFRTLNEELIEINMKLEKCKNIVNAVQNDDVDAYISFLKQRDNNKIDTIARTKLKRRIVDINQELIKLDKLLNMAKPSSTFDLGKWKIDCVNELKEAKVKKTSQEEERKRLSHEDVEKVTSKMPPVDKHEALAVKRDVEKVAVKEPVPKIVEKAAKPILKSPPANDPPASSIRAAKKADVAKDNEIESYDKLAMTKEYSVWLPPEGQTGDGKTKLNEKFGY